MTLPTSLLTSVLVSFLWSFIIYERTQNFWLAFGAYCILQPVNAFILVPKSWEEKK